MTDNELICLLPVRNGEFELADYFACVKTFVDGVVALDDGSTDGTLELLRNEPLVRIVLTNPVRETYAGWDDSANRNRLLDAAASLEPNWILSLDADERLPADDATALRAFLATDARAGAAYGLRVHRMIGDQGFYDKNALWVYRLFRYRKGQRFPRKRQHFVPVPADIPRGRWFRSTFRIQHFASTTTARREARFAKYLLADPECEYQDDYSNLLAPPGDLQPWRHRPQDLCPLDLSAQERMIHSSLSRFEPSAKLDPGRPVLSTITIARGDGQVIAGTMRSIVAQETSVSVEFILVTSDCERTAPLVRAQFPNVTVVELDTPALPGRARNAGLQLARGDVISFPGSHVELPPGSLEARVRAHDLGYAMVTGSVLNGTRTLSGWASYFMDHTEALPGRPSGELSRAPSHCSYLREVLIDAGAFPEELRAGEDTAVNLELFRRGYRAYRSADITLVHKSPCRNPIRLVHHHFTRGRAYGRLLLANRFRSERLPPRRLRLCFHLASIYPLRRARYILRDGWRWGRGMRCWLMLVSPLIAVGIVSAAFGALIECLGSKFTEDS